MIVVLASMAAAAGPPAHVNLGVAALVHERRLAAVVGVRVWRIDLRTAPGIRPGDGWRTQSTVAFDLSRISDHDHLLGIVHAYRSHEGGDLPDEHRYGVAYAYHAPRGFMVELSGWAPTRPEDPALRVGAQLGWVIKIRPRRAAAWTLRRRSPRGSERAPSPRPEEDVPGRAPGSSSPRSQ